MWWVICFDKNYCFLVCIPLFNEMIGTQMIFIDKTSQGINKVWFVITFCYSAFDARIRIS